MNSIVDLLTILNARTPGDSIVRLSLTRLELLALRACAFTEIHHLASVDCGEGSDGRVETDIGLWVGNGVIFITIVPEQDEAFRLWDDNGGELFINSG